MQYEMSAISGASHWDIKDTGRGHGNEACESKEATTLSMSFGGNSLNMEKASVYFIGEKRNG